jgi:hypothetical protein
MAAKKPSTALTTPKVALPANYEEVQQADINAFKNRLAISESNKIAVTQDAHFKVPTSDGDAVKAKTVSGIIVDFAARRNYYDVSFDRDNPVPPRCFAIGFVTHDNLLPDEEALDTQNSACRGCAMNVWDKDAKGKWIPPLCSSSYRLAILAPDDNGEGRLMTLDISSTATKHFDKYVRALAAVQKAPYNVVTDFSFDPACEYPSVRFTAGADVPKTAIGFVLTTRDEAVTLVTRKPNLEVTEAAKPAKKLPAPRKPLKKAA